MFVNVTPSPASKSETLCSLNFAARCRAVQLGTARRVSAASGGASRAGGGTPVR
jgi:kinesin family protein C2/C3